MTEQANELTSSYYRCRRDERFLDTFYDAFLSKSPEVAQLFAKTDFRIQKLMLRQSLLEMLCFDREMSGAREEIERLHYSTVVHTSSFLLVVVRNFTLRPSWPGRATKR